MIWIWLIFGLLVALLVGNLFTAILQDYFIFRPSKLKPEFVYSFDHPFTEKTLSTVERGSINLLHFHGSDLNKKLILYCHGNTTNLSKWGDTHKMFTDLGYDFISFDYRGFGKSTGTRNEQNFHADARAVYTYACENYLPEDIIIFGRSLGSGIATRLAAEQSHSALILETPFASMPFLFRTYYPFLPARLFRFKYIFDNIACFKRITGEIYIFHGTRDTVVPFNSSKRLKKEFLNKKSELIVLPRGKHINLSEFALYKDRLNAILRDKNR